MNTYYRIFGTGPRGLFISLLLLAPFLWLEDHFLQYTIFDNHNVITFIFILSIILTCILVVWSVKSLPPAQRGENLVTKGAFKYFRHPLYASFLLFFNFGLAIFLNNWIYILWAILQFPVWSWNVRREELLMYQVFKDKYKNYAQKTGRFIPKL